MLTIKIIMFQNKNKSRKNFPDSYFYQYRYFRVIFLSWYFALAVYALIALIPLLSFSHFRSLASNSFHSRYFLQLPWHPAQRASQLLQGQIIRSIINASNIKFTSIIYHQTYIVSTFYFSCYTWIIFNILTIWCYIIHYFNY